MIIYKILNKITNKIYIGKTTRSIEERWLEHCKPVMQKRSAIGKAIQKYGKENFEITELAKAYSEEDLNRLECQFIEQLKSLSPYGYNLSKGGEGVSHCEESIEKIRKSMIGKKISEEHKKALSDKLKNRIPANRKPVIGYNPKTGEVVRLPHSYADPRFKSPKIGECCRGVRPHYKGFIWKFDE